jgi:hypothetical protein
MTKSDVLVGFTLPKANASANFMGEEWPWSRHRSPDEAKRYPRIFPTTRNPDYRILPCILPFGPATAVH